MKGVLFLERSAHGSGCAGELKVIRRGSEAEKERRRRSVRVVAAQGRAQGRARSCEWRGEDVED